MPYKSGRFSRRNANIALKASRQCSTCGRRFDRSYNYQEHQKTHNPNREKPFKCSKCDKTFTRKADMSRHVKFVGILLIIEIDR